MKAFGELIDNNIVPKLNKFDIDPALMRGCTTIEFGDDGTIIGHEYKQGHFDEQIMDQYYGMTDEDGEYIHKYTNLEG